MAKPLPLQSHFPLTLVGIASVAGALVTGLFIGRLASPDAPDSAAIAAAQSPSATAGASPLSPADDSATSEMPGRRREGASPNRADPIAQLKSARQVGGDIGRIMRMLGILSQLTEDEIPGVLAYAVGSPAGQREQQEMILFAALARWAQFDPAATAEWTRGNAGKILKGKGDELLEMALSEWTARDPSAARAWIGQLTDPGEKAGAFQGYFGALAAHDPAAALRELKRPPEGARPDRAYLAIFSSWINADPRAAAAAAASLPELEGDTRRRVLEGVAQGWAQQAPRETMAWALQLAQPDEQAHAVRQVLGEWMRSEPEAAVAQVLSLPEHLRNEAARGVIEGVAQKDPADARRIAELLPAGSGREQALGIVAVTWAGRDPGAAADFARNLSGETAEDAWPKIARTWVQRGETSAAAQWVVQLPEGAARGGAARNVIDRWAKAEPAAAAQWLEQLSPGPTRDAAAGAFATQVRETDPAGAMEWAATIGNLPQREATVRQVLETWRKKDSVAARAWLEKTNAIGADLRSVLLRTP